MTLVEALRKIQHSGLAVMSTRDVAASLEISNAHASKLLARLSQSEQLVHFGRGLWAVQKKMNSLLIPQYLVAPFPAYISLQTALYHHDMIDQIPSVIYAVSLARTRIFETPMGDVNVCHIAPNFFFGFDVDDRTGVTMATQEKALLDLIYLGCGRTSYFKALPEIEFPRSFSFVKARKMIEKIESKRLRTLVSNRFEALCAAGNTRRDK
jgi:Predicted transcriptional regulator